MTYRQPEEEPMLLRIEQVAELLQVSRATAYSLAARREIPTVRIGRVIRVRRDQLEPFLQRHAVR